MEFLVAVVALLFVGAMIAGIVSGIKQGKNDSSKKYIDRQKSQSTQMNHAFSEEELNIMQKVAEFCKKKRHL